MFENVKKSLQKFRSALKPKRLARACAFLSLGLLAGCSNLLPQEKTVVASPFDTYAEAEAAFDKVVPHQTDLAELFDS
ncbi:MAG: hypothetical protein EP340_04660, partial [Alphaproteobacteria bacterium]